VAFYVVHLTVPKDTVVAATGVEVGRVLPDAAHTTITYVSGATRDFALALSPDYQTVSRTVGETTVRAYYTPGHEAGGRQALSVAAEALAVYAERFGPYPYTELDVAETAFTVAGSPGGVEFPGIVFVSSEFYRPNGPFRNALDVVVAHEVAHQWWYGVVGNNPVDEPWLDEALATYASILYVEAAHGESAEEVLWSQALLPYQFARALGQDGPVGRSSLAYADDSQAYQAIVYGKGALFLAQLRELLGDADFNAVLRHHYQTHKYGVLQAGDLRESLAAVLEDTATGSSQRPELDRTRAEALALYDAVVVRGEPLVGLETLLSTEGRERLAGLLEVLAGDLPPEALQDIDSLFEELLKSSKP